MAEGGEDKVEVSEKGRQGKEEGSKEPVTTTSKSSKKVSICRAVVLAEYRDHATPSPCRSTRKRLARRMALGLLRLWGRVLGLP